MVDVNHPPGFSMHASIQSTPQLGGGAVKQIDKSEKPLLTPLVKRSRPSQPPSQLSPHPSPHHRLRRGGHPFT